MSNTRTVNTLIFKRKMSAKGERGLELFAIESGLSYSTLERVKRGTYVPSTAIRKLICLLLGLSEDELFPLVESQAA